MTLEGEKKRWEEGTINPALKRNPERKPEFLTTSGIAIPRVLVSDEVRLDFESQVGFPGEYPYTRGVQPTMYRGRIWTMRQYAGYASAEEFEPALSLSSGARTDRTLGSF